MHSWDENSSLRDRRADCARSNLQEILEGYPDLQEDDVKQAIEYAAWLTQEEIHTH